MHSSRIAFSSLQTQQGLGPDGVVVVAVVEVGFRTTVSVPETVS